MSQSDQFGNDNLSNENDFVNSFSDPYTSESSADLYSTPDVGSSVLQETDTPDEVTVDEAGDVTETNADVEADVSMDDVNGNGAGEESVDSDFSEQEKNPCDDGYQDGQTAQEVNPYGDGYYNTQMVQSQSSQSSQPYANPYGGQAAQGANPYGNGYYGQTTQGSNPYGNGYYGGQAAQGANPYGNGYYGGQTAQGANPNGNGYYGGQTAQGANPNGNGYYGGQTAQGANPYGNGAYGGQTQSNQGKQTQNAYGNPPYGNPPNYQYSPFATPPKKNNTGLIIGIVVGIIVLFLIAVFALAYKAYSLYEKDRSDRRREREEYIFEYDDRDRDERRDDYEKPDENDYDDGYDDDFYNDLYDDFDYDHYDDDYDYDSEKYYTLHDDIKTDLSYQVDFDYYEYDSDNENVAILVSYPIVKGDNVSNLDKINSALRSEVDVLTEYFEEEYEDYIVDEDSYFTALSTGYVTYMDEEKMSVVFSEYIYSDYYVDVFLYSINIDMENGMILDNESILNIDDEFSVEFRQRSDVQNGEISYLTSMSDQQMTRLLNSSDVIVFYTPKGMEIGFNYEEGWVTVTYEEYEKYLKVF